MCETKTNRTAYVIYNDYGYGEKSDPIAVFNDKGLAFEYINRLWGENVDIGETVVTIGEHTKVTGLTVYDIKDVDPLGVE